MAYWKNTICFRDPDTKPKPIIKPTPPKDPETQPERVPNPFIIPKPIIKPGKSPAPKA